MNKLSINLSSAFLITLSIIGLSGLAVNTVHLALAIATPSSHTSTYHK